MSFRSALLALGFGLALGLASALALGVGAVEEEAVIVVRPVELVDPAPHDPFDVDPLFAPDSDVGDASASVPAARPGFNPGSSVAPAKGARERPVELIGGDVVTIRGLDVPALRLAAEDVAFFELAESALGEDGGLEAETAADEADESDGPPRAADARFAVYAVLSESGRAAWMPFAAEHANAFLLVELEGRPVDLVRPLGWSRGLRIAVFPDELSRSRWVESLDIDAH